LKIELAIITGILRLSSQRYNFYLKKILHISQKFLIIASAYQNCCQSYR